MRTLIKILVGISACYCDIVLASVVITNSNCPFAILSYPENSSAALPLSAKKGINAPAPMMTEILGKGETTFISSNSFYIKNAFYGNELCGGNMGQHWQLYRYGNSCYCG